MQVIKQPTTFADQSQQTTARVMILLVRREMRGQLVDPGRRVARPELQASHCHWWFERWLG